MHNDSRVSALPQSNTVTLGGSLGLEPRPLDPKSNALNIRSQCLTVDLFCYFLYLFSFSLCPQNVIYELINTEQTYMDDLSATLEVST